MSGLNDDDLNSRLGVISAPTSRRAMAFVVDLGVLLIVTAPVWFGAGALLRLAENLLSDAEAARDALADAAIPLAIGLGLGTVLLLAQLIVEGVRGVTLGKAALGLRAVNVETLLKPGVGNVMLRGAIVWSAGTAVPVLGAVPFLVSVWSDPTERGRAWHDRATDFWLVDVRHGLDPRDREALRAARRELTRPTEARFTPPRSLASNSVQLDPALTTIPRSTAGVISARAGEPAEWELETQAVPTGQQGPAVAAGRVEQPVTPDAAPARRSGPTGWIMVLDDGARHTLPARTLIGRSPSSPGGGTDYALVPVSDPAMQMSRTHLAVTIEGGHVWVADLDTSNGTEVVLPHGERRMLPPREQHRLDPGSRVVIGDRTFTFEEADQ